MVNQTIHPVALSPVRPQSRANWPTMSNPRPVLSVAAAHGLRPRAAFIADVDLQLVAADRGSDCEVAAGLTRPAVHDRVCDYFGQAEHGVTSGRAAVQHTGQELACLPDLLAGGREGTGPGERRFGG